MMAAAKVPTTGSVARRAALRALFMLGTAHLVWTERLVPVLASTHELSALAANSAPLGSSVCWFLKTGLLLAVAAMSTIVLNGLEVYGLVRPLAPPKETLPPWPFDPSRTQLIVGELHEQAGEPSDAPGWLVLDEKALVASVGVFGAVRRGKTAGALYPFLDQLLSLHPNDRSKRLGGLIIDAKGNMAGDVRRMCIEAGRESDFYEISIPNARYNILNRADLSPTVLSGLVFQLMRNVSPGGASDAPFWERAAQSLCTQSLRAVRLAYGRPPTFVDLYRTASSPKAFEETLEAARARLQENPSGAGPYDREEVEQLEYWYARSLKALSAHTRSGIAETLNSLCSLFDEPVLRRCFCPPPRPAGARVTGERGVPEWETFEGFESLLDEGKIVVLSLPIAVYKTVATVVGTMVKLNFQDACMARLARAETANGNVGRTVFFLADEFDQFASPDDGDFWARCPEARVINIIALQSYKSLAAKLRDRDLMDRVLANISTKIWFGLECNFTSKEAAELCGKIDREKMSRTVSESASKSLFSFLDRRSVSEGHIAESASTNWTLREEYLFPPRAFTSLRVFQAIVKAFDGEASLPPTVCYMKPYFSDPNLSWFGSRGGGETRG